MLAPKIDQRDHAKVLEELQELVSIYVPELKYQKDEAGSALPKIFAHMVDHIVTRFNDVPNKNFVSYLNMLGIKRLPAQPARVPVQFYLSEGTTEDVLIPSETQVATSETQDHPQVIFETEKNMNVTVSQLKAIYSVDPDQDQIFNHSNEILSGKKLKLFFDSPSQQHALYLGHEYLLNFKDGQIKLKIDPSAGEFFDNVEWEYWGYDQQKKKDNWLPLEKVDKSSQDITLEFASGSARPIIEDPKAVDEDYNDILKAIRPDDRKPAFWIRARLKPNLPAKFPIINSLNDSIIKSISCIDIEDQASFQPDGAFYNDTPINLSEPFYPFGNSPSTHDQFYIGCEQVFSKKDATITITFVLISNESKRSLGGNLLLSLEYWNGKGWSQITQWDKTVNLFESFPEEIKFKCPRNISPTQINGKKSYWLRFHIVSVDYGIQIINLKDFKKALFVLPPKIERVDINYEYKNEQEKAEPQSFQYCYTKNNLQLSDCSGLEQFIPFKPQEDRNQAIYLGFDNQFGNGRISVFFALAKQEYLENKKPRINWSYLRTRNGRAEWVPLQVLDETDNLTRSGTIEFLGPSDIDKAKKFGQSLYWIRAEVTEHPFQPYSKILTTIIDKSIAKAKVERIPLKRVLINPLFIRTLALFANKVPFKTLYKELHPKKAINTESLQVEYWSIPEDSHEENDVKQLVPFVSMGPCVSEDFWHPKFAIPKEVKEIPAAPEVEGIFLNTTWASQTETVSDENLGSSDGVANLSFSFRRPPVFSEAVWVLEPTVPDKDILLGKEGDLKVIDSGEVWVRWHTVEDFSESTNQDRHYTVDRVSGTLRFGNGRNGMIPPVGGTIKAAYKTGGGRNGNVGIDKVNSLLNSIAFIDRVHNPDVAQGGADAESLDSVLEKGPKRLQHHNRAVAKEDYEWLAREASRAVARAKCIPNLNDSGEKQLGCVSVIVVPESPEVRPKASPELLRIVEVYLRRRMPVSVSSLTVTSPSYLRVSVSADIYVTSIKSASEIKFSAVRKLEHFLHPLHGGYNGNGWDFGKLPCNSDILTILQELQGVDYVENLSITVRDDHSGRTVTVRNAENLPAYTLISSDVHQLEIRSIEVG